MFLLAGAIALADPAPEPFPERSPTLIEACLANAIDIGEVSDTEDSHKYICSGEAAERLWSFLENEGVAATEQDVGAEGRWLSRYFPLGGCFKRVRLADGSVAKTGLSCTVWIPRPRS